ncbi:MAG: GIY-YIG nuclease family protein [Thermodesulfobacteriota bacterium]
MPKKDCTSELLKLFESEDADLFVAKEKPKAFTADERLAESFQQIIDFVQKNGKEPEIDSGDFQEALLAKRLETIKNTPKKVDCLEQFDSLGLLTKPETPKSVEELFEKDELGLFGGDENKIFDIKHVKQKRVTNPVDERATRIQSKDFSLYKPIFEDAQGKLKNGEAKLVLFTSIDQLLVGRLYVYDGQMVYVADEGEIDQKEGYKQQRLKVIIENGTESNMYKRSLAQRLYEGGYCVVDKKELIDDISNEAEKINGYIYVVRSLSEDPKINTIENLYKIGFSKTPVSQRIANAKDDPTYLMAEVELIESYKLTGDYNPQKVEHVIHRIFADVALDLNITDKHGREYKPMEWYSVPINIIREVVDLIDSGEIVNYIYDSHKQKMTPIAYEK